jgi:hypothetical protein
MTHRIDVLEKRDETIFAALKKMEDKFDSKLDLILFQINKIAVLEANHNNHAQGMQRAFSKIESLESADRELEAFRNKTEGMAKMAWILWGAIGSGVLALLVEVFLKKP